jgi:ethanolamine utilization protein EutA
VPVVHLGAAVPPAIDPDAVAAQFIRNAQRLDQDLDSMLALGFSWSGPPEYERLAAMGRAITRAVAPGGRRDRLLVLLIDGDVGQTLGRLLSEELGVATDLVSIDGVRVADLDFVDIGDRLDPPGVFPVVIKSLIFDEGPALIRPE